MTADSPVVLFSQSWTNPEPISCSIQGSNCCFLTHIQVSQETGKVVWYSHLSKSFPQFILIQTVKGFSVVNETEIDVFLKFPCLLYNPVNVGNLISSSYSISKLGLDIWKFLVHIMLEPGLQGFCMTFLAWDMDAIVRLLARSLVLPLLGIEMTDLFQSCGHCWVFRICWHNEYNTLMASSFWDLNSSAGISLHPLALLIAVLLKTHLTSYTRMSGSGRQTTRSY